MAEACVCCGTGPLHRDERRKDGLCSVCREMGKHRCGAMTKKGTPCTRWTRGMFAHCKQHRRDED
jgi:hypothetical protein